MILDFCSYIGMHVHIHVFVCVCISSMTLKKRLKFVSSGCVVFLNVHQAVHLIA